MDASNTTHPILRIPSTCSPIRQLAFGWVQLIALRTQRNAHQANTKYLTCQRPLRRLLRDTRRISGHIAQVTAYEEARGELRYTVYLADRAARLQLKVDTTALERVLPDGRIETGEQEALTSEDASRFLIPVTDRLAISPSRTAVSMGSRRITLRTRASLSSHGFILKLRCKVGVTRRLPGVHNSGLLIVMSRHQRVFPFFHRRVALAGMCFRSCRSSLVHLIF